MPLRQPSDRERLRALRVERERVNAELNAVEDGTLPFIEERGDVTAETLAEAFDLSLPAANNRLARLVEVGLLDREPRTRRPVGGRFSLDGGYDRAEVEACEYHPAHRWTIQRTGDVLGNDRPDSDDLWAFCVGCFVGRCGGAIEENPCMLPNHHPERHLYADGTEEPADEWPGNTRTDPPTIPGVNA